MIAIFARLLDNRAIEQSTFDFARKKSFTLLPDRQLITSFAKANHL